MPIRVLLASSREHIRRGVREIVATLDTVVIAGEAGSREHAIASMQKLAPDVLLLDMEIAGASAILVARIILDRLPHLGIVVLLDLSESADLADQKARSMRYVGALRCVGDDVQGGELEQAIVAAADGGAFLDARLAQRALLSPREHELLEMIVFGWEDTRIAGRLKISTSTVRSHTRRICQKLGVATRSGALERGRALGLHHDLDKTLTLDSYYADYRAKREIFYHALEASRWMHGT